MLVRKFREAQFKQNSHNAPQSQRLNKKSSNRKFHRRSQACPFPEKTKMEKHVIVCPNKLSYRRVIIFHKNSLTSNTRIVAWKWKKLYSKRSRWRVTKEGDEDVPHMENFLQAPMLSPISVLGYSHGRPNILTNFRGPCIVGFCIAQFYSSWLSIGEIDTGLTAWGM